METNMKSEIKSGPFTLLVSLCGEYWVAPDGLHIESQSLAESVARFYGRVMAGDEDE